MSSPSTATLPFLLAHYQVLEIEGPDAADFLQRQTMNDVRALQPGTAQWNGLLSAKGRLLSLFRLHRVGEQQFQLIGRDGDGEYLRDALQRVRFRSQLKLTFDPACQVWACAADREGCLSWPAGRALCLTREPLGPATAEDGEQDWHRIDLLHGLPLLFADTRDLYTPQMLGLARHGAFSLSKGCYPGQEIVARTHYLGQQKRDLRLLRAERTLQRGEPILADGREIGRVVDALTAAPWALAVSAEAEASARLSDGTDVSWQPLLPPT